MHPEERAAQRDTERGWFTYLAHCDVVNRAVVERFRDAGIRFALPAHAVRLTDQGGGNGGDAPSGRG